MATLDTLKWALRRCAISTSKQPLSDSEYSDGFDTLVQGPGFRVYREFIIPQLSQLLTPLLNSRAHISVLEIGPGPKSVFGYLPSHQARKISRYVAFEPNHLFATRLEECLRSTSGLESPLPCLESPPDIHRTPFEVDGATRSGTGSDNEFDIILFCHSMYGMSPKGKFIERSLEMLCQQPGGAMVVVFHRDGTLHFDGLVCHRTVPFPTGVIVVPNVDETLDRFASFVAGFSIRDVETKEAILVEWRKACRDLARREEADQGGLAFSAPEVMVVFTSNATTLPELTAQVPAAKGDKIVKNREAQRYRPAWIVGPTEVRHVQQCVQWAVKHAVGLTVIGGGHSGHCLWPNVVSVDMSAFNQVHIFPSGDGSETQPLAIVEAGCKTGDIVRETLSAGLTVPLGSRPSVGAGLWLQGGIGHLARLHGLACDAIVGAVVVSASGEILHIGHVPIQYRPTDAMKPENETDILWAIKGAGTNFGIVISVTFRAYVSPTYTVRNWILPRSDNLEAQRSLRKFNQFAKGLPRNHSADAYLYWDADKLHVGVTAFESSVTGLACETPTTPMPANAILGPEGSIKTVDGTGLFESEMYMSGMHGGHGGGKTSSFKRCLFFKDIGADSIAEKLVAMFETRRSEFCYFHLLHGGGAVRDTKNISTAFGCRDWDFACVITGVWPRNQDGTETARAIVQWVYDVALNLLPLSSGAYGADLGPDPRDAELVAKAFGPNRGRLARLKRSLDPSNVFAYSCPLAAGPVNHKLIILLTGDSCAGKDYVGNLFASLFIRKRLTARTVSISDATKREYAAATGAELNRLLQDRAYKEEHRLALTAFFQLQVQERPQLPEEHFLDIVYEAIDVDVLIITGMRDEAPVATLSHLVPGSRLLEVRVRASKATRQIRRGCQCPNTDDRSNPTVSDYRPNLVFDNEVSGSEAAERFAERHLLPFFHEDMQRLADMVRSIPDFPRPGIEFRHVLNIVEQAGGLALCTSLMQSHFTGNWDKVCAVVSCEAGGFIYGPALAMRVNVPNVLIREAGKLPPPTISVTRAPSHIASLSCRDSKEPRIEIGQYAVPRSGSVLVVDDVLATGKTLCAVLRLLDKAGIGAERIDVMAVAEFPAHRGRELLRQSGLGGVNVQSLLVFDGV